MKRSLPSFWNYLKTFSVLALWLLCRLDTILFWYNGVLIKARPNMSR